MNRIFLKPLLAAVLLFSVGTASAATAIGEDWVGDVYYWFYDDGHAVVESDSYSGPDYSGRVVIPATVTYNGTTYNVTEIGEYVFRDCPVTEVILPEGLKKIGRQQFWGCDNLKSITIPSTVTEIGYDAFNSNAENYYSDPAIETITFEDGTEPLAGFSEFSDGTTYAAAIQLGKNVKTVYLGRDVLISRGENVENLTIGGIVTELDGGTDFFTANEALKTLTIEYGDAPLSLERTNDGDGTFSKYPIETLTLDRQLEYDGTDGITPFSGSQKLTSVVIGDHVTSIGDNFFNGCAGMQSLSVGAVLQSIGENAFLGCTGLQRVELKNLSAWCRFNFGSEEQNPLYYAKNLYMDGNLVTDLTLPSGVAAVGDYAFYGCDKLTAVALPASVETIGIGAFGECTALKDLTFEDGSSKLTLVTGNGDRPFRNAPIETLYLGRNIDGLYFPDDLASLRKVTVGNDVTEIKSELFVNSTDLQEVHISDLVAWCGIDFEDSDCNPLSMAHKLYVDGSLLTGLAIPSSISVVKPYTFYGGECFTSLSLHDGITDMGEYAFYGCSGLTSVDLPAGVATLNPCVFAGCSGLASVTIPANIKKINSSAFADCTGIKQVVFEDSQEELLVDGIYNYPLFYNSAIEKMYIGRNISGTTGSVMSVDYRLSSLTIGSMVTKIDKIFAGSSLGNPDAHTPFLDELIIEDSDMPLPIAQGVWYSWGTVDGTSLYLGRNVEYEYKSAPFGVLLGSVELGEKVTEISPYMFSGCDRLESVIINGTVDEIGEAAFQYCSSLTSFDVPESVVSIRDNTFQGCAGLTYFDIPATVASIGASAFEDCTGLFSLRFESGSEISGIAARTFCGCTGLLAINLPESVTSIGESAFQDCSALTDLHLSQAVNSVGNRAFYGCLSLRTVRVDNPEPPVAYANTFSVNTYLNATLSVPSGSQEAYNMAECWYNFRNKEEFPFGSVGTIGDDALNVYFEGSELIVDGAGNDAVVEVYNIAGQRVYSGAVKPVALGKGLYIVHVAGRTFKVAL